MTDYSYDRRAAQTPKTAAGIGLSDSMWSLLLAWLEELMKNMHRAFPENLLLEGTKISGSGRGSMVFEAKGYSRADMEAESTVMFRENLDHGGKIIGSVKCYYKDVRLDDDMTLEIAVSVHDGIRDVISNVAKFYANR
jgi:hypothetical protein